jgi:hypothetical protein
MKRPEPCITVGWFVTVAGYALQRVDGTYPHVRAFGAELFDCLGVAVGHLPCPGQGEVPAV